MAQMATKISAPPKSEHSSRLQIDLASQILRLLKEQNAGPGHRLVEVDLCEHFGVSRTPIRGALKKLAAQGLLEARTNRGFILLEPITKVPEAEPVNMTQEQDNRLISAIAKGHNTGTIPTDVKQQELCRMFDVTLPTVLRVLGQLAEIGLVERKMGNGWTFLPSIDSPRAQAESYAFRQVIEPALVTQATFELDYDWLKACRERHIAFRKKVWRDTMAVEFYDMNSDFHEGLALCSGNRYLLGAVKRQIQLRTFLNYHWDYRAERVHESIDEHLKILDALENGDHQRASDLIRDHLISASGETSTNGL